MFKLPKFWSRKSVELEAKGVLPTPADPNVKGKRQAVPSYATQAKMAQVPLPRRDRRLATTDITTFRNGASTSKVLRDFAAASPELSSAIFSYLRVGISSGYLAVARNPDGTANPEATSALQQVIARFDVLPDYTMGFNGVASLLSLSEALAKELLFEGAMCGELVLDKTRMPAFIQPLSVSNMLMQPDKDGYLVPVQSVGGVKTVLDSPAIFYVALDQDLLQPYASSPLEASVKAILFSEQFVNDIQRVVQKAIHPRMGVTIDEDKFRKHIPQAIENDEEAMVAYQNEFVQGIASMVNDLAPEDAMVFFDSIGIELMNNGNTSLANEYEFISQLATSKLASGAKTMPAVLGMGKSQNVASTESMLFVKAASGAIRAKLNEFYSRSLTLAVRLMGFDVYVQFEYDSIDLRPDGELEAFRSVKQSRILELLSLGFYTDEEASLILTKRLPPPGMKPLSGTMFQSTPAAAPGDGTSNDGSALSKDVGAGSAGVKGTNKAKNPLQKQK